MCVRQKGEHLYVATDNNDVQIIKFPSGDRDGVLMRSTAHISHIAIGKEHEVSIDTYNFKFDNIIYGLPQSLLQFDYIRDEISDDCHGF